MSYVAPNSTIILLEDCPLDSTYDHTIKWDSATEQYNYFYSLRKLTLDNATYQRVNKGTLKVQVPNVLYNIYNCNYLMFRNESFENKWFYAFITRCDYVNNITYEISYEIDVMQTWYFDYEVDEVFVERENTGTDAIGDNLIEENLDVGDYVQGDSYYIPFFPSDSPYVSFVLVCTCTYSNSHWHKDIQGQIRSNVYSGLNYYVYNSAANLNNAINGIVSDLGDEAIVSIYPIPTQYKEQVEGTASAGVEAVSVNIRPNQIGNYVPVNNKLLTYPYVGAMLSDQQGGNLLLRWEFWYPSAGGRQIQIFTNPIDGFKQMYVPVKYKTNVTTPNLDYRLVIDYGSPCAWVSDMWKAYRAQHANSLAVEILNKATDVSLSVATGLAGIPSLPSGATSTQFLSSDVNRQLRNGVIDAAGQTGQGLIDSGSNVAQFVAQVQDYKRLPPTVHNASATDVYSMYNTHRLLIYNQEITEEYARKIDKYFSKFGYAVKEVKVPNVFTSTACTNWNYIRTKGCTLTGSVPNDDLSKISQIYNNGITFWNEPEYVGNYSHYGWSCR